MFINRNDHEIYYIQWRPVLMCYCAIAHWNFAELYFIKIVQCKLLILLKILRIIVSDHASLQTVIAVFVHQRSFKHICSHHSRTCWSRTRPKTLHFATQHATDGIHMPIAVWGVGGLWTMESDAMACDPLVQHSKDRNELLKQAGPNCYSTLTSTQHFGWSCTVQHSHADKMAVIPFCGHITWSSTCLSLRTTLFSPLVPYMHNCRSSMPCRSLNATAWQTCFPETNHSAPFECTRLLILRPLASTRHTCTSFHILTLLGSSALTEQGITLDIAGDTRDVTVGAYVYAICLEM